MAHTHSESNSHPAQDDGRRSSAGRRRAMVTPTLMAVAGVVILVVAVALEQAISVGSALGVLLLLSAAVRFEIARRT